MIPSELIARFNLTRKPEAALGQLCPERLFCFHSLFSTVKQLPGVRLEAVSKLLGSDPILRSPRSKMGLTCSVENLKC